MTTEDDAIANVRLVLERNCLQLISDEGEERFAIQRAWEKDGQRYLEVKLGQSARDIRSSRAQRGQLATGQ